MCSLAISSLYFIKLCSLKIFTFILLMISSNIMIWYLLQSRELPDIGPPCFNMPGKKMNRFYKWLWHVPKVTKGRKKMSGAPKMMKFYVHLSSLTLIEMPLWYVLTPDYDSSSLFNFRVSWSISWKTTPNPVSNLIQNSRISFCLIWDKSVQLYR